MSRSTWKNLRTVQNKIGNKLNTIKIWKRSDIITSGFVGKTVFIYNGKIFKKISITREKIGYKYGDFSGTRIHKAAPKKNVKISKK